MRWIDPRKQTEPTGSTLLLITRVEIATFYPKLVPVLARRKYKRIKTDMAHSVLRFWGCPVRIDCDQTIDSKRDKPQEH
ncbi:MAG TPA: hypothetical protein VE974_24665, partial [Thermoanaerobaculia bacterium]|nr:hypothetical protein [Thermoanaerobaculia bacterium]